MASGGPDGQQIQPTAVETVNLEDFVDVVYSYKCKFCQFSSNSPQGISSHVVQVHLIHGKRPVATNVTADAEADSGIATLSNYGHTSQIAVEETQSTEGQQVLQASAQEVNAPESVAVVQYESEVLSDMKSNSTDKPEQMDASAQFSSDAVTATSELECGSQTDAQREDEKLIIIENRPPMGPKPDGRVLDTEAAEDLGASAADQGDYRELFVCGQCSVAFTDIEECKVHMINEHNISAVETTYETAGGSSPEREYLGPNRVSVATQVQLNRKPGRKRKGEIDVGKIIVKKEPTSIVNQKLEHTDLSLITKRMAGVEGKRVVRPPKNLVEDYYIGRQKRKAPRRPICRLLCTQKRCRAKFRTKAALEIHEKSHREVKDLNTGSTQAIFTCVECEHSFGSWKPLQMHMWKEHQLDTDLCKCSYCDFRADSWQKVEMHAETHNDENPFECDLCGASFKRKAQLIKHNEEHSGVEQPSTEEATTSKPEDDVAMPEPVISRGRGHRPVGLSPVCDICGRNFANMKCLKSHNENVHQKQKPYTCKFCGYTTGRKAMLDLHVRTHTGEKPYKCDLCNYQTSDHNTMRRHRMRHTGDRPYKCQFCPYECIQSISLKTHLKNKHPGTGSIYSCTQCQYHTVNKAYYLNHVEDHKRGLVEEMVLAPLGDKAGKGRISARADIRSDGVNLVVPSSSVSFVPSSNVISLAAKEAELIQEPGVVMSLQVGDGVQEAMISDAGVSSIVVQPQEVTNPESMEPNPQEHLKLTTLEAAETFTIEAPGSQAGTYLGMISQDQQGTPNQVILTIQTNDGQQQILMPTTATSTVVQGQTIIRPAPVIEAGTTKAQECGTEGDVIQVSVADSGAGLQHIITAIENMNEQAVEGIGIEGQGDAGHSV